MDESLLDLSDDEFLERMANPVALATEVEAKSLEENEASDEQATSTETTEVTATDSVETTDTTVDASVTTETSTTEADTTTAATTEVVTEQADGQTAAEVNYKEFYDRMLGQPIKANGKEIKIETPEEAIQLMQMGANYTKKMQALAPHRKILSMLESQGLLDEAKLSYLIDLEKKNPEAIAKLVKESGIRPMDIDTESDNYQATNYSVPESDIEFKTILDDLRSTQEGQETIQIINSTWDDVSIGAFRKEPELITTIHEQMNTGVYQMIVGEIERQKLFGKIKPNTPFLSAYSTVGSELEKKGSFANLAKPTQVTEPKTPVALTTSQPKTPVANKSQAAAVAINRSVTAKPATHLVNPLAMSDEDFLKQFANR